MDDTQRIRNTWARAMIARDAVGVRFYTVLFRDAPETRALFPATMEAQAQKLVATLNFIVDHLDEEEALTQAACDLAIRHVNYGVAPEHYDAVGAALIQTLADMLGSEFRPADRDAWARSYTALAQAMVAAAYPSETYTKV